MRKATIALHALLAVAAVAILGTVWVLMFVNGSGGFFSPFRTVRLGSARIVQYFLCLYSLVGVPAGFFCACRAIQLGTRSGRGVFRGWYSLRALSNVFAVLAILLIVVGVAAENPIGTLRSLPIFRGEAAAPPGPTEDRLNYPDLPLEQPGPYAWSIYTLDGEEVPMQRFRGKVVFLNAWATWCGYCVREFPNIERLYERMRGRDDIAVLLVSPEEPATVRAWAEKQEFKLPFYTLSAQGPDEAEEAATAGEEESPPPSFPSMFSIRGLPTTFILTHDGRIAYTHSGMAAWDGPKTVEFLNGLADLAKGSASDQ